MSEDLLYEIMDSNYSRNLTFAAYHKLCAWICGITERIVDNLDEDTAKNVSKDLLEEIGLSGDIIELHDRLLRNNRLLCTAFMNEKKSDSNLKNILQYIDANFNKNINLDGVAYNFGYNSSYLSRLFKHIKGVSFTDYLGKKRIEYAKKLLTNQNKTIKEIAVESGYNSTGIFIKAFEKIEGVTPGEFRKRK
jgi:YesN/AraC family two-component response regulator